MTALTRKCQYALRALYFLAREYGKGPILIPRISAHAKAPPDFLQTILVELKHAGILESRRGRTGGYSLAVPPDQVTLGAVIRLMDGPLIALPCVNDRGVRRCADCGEAEICETRLVMLDVRAALSTILDKTSLISVCRRTPATDSRIEL